MRLLIPSLAVLLLTLPLWLDGAHRTTDLSSLSQGTAPLLERATDHSSASASGAVHCALHCAPQMLFPALLLCAMMLPLIRSNLPVVARFRARLGSAPPLPPPRTH